MPILNYTTGIPVHKTIGEIQEKLARAGARSIAIDYDEHSQPIALMFLIVVNQFPINFRLPSRHDGVLKQLINDSTIPRKFKTDEQARRVAWRILKDWVEAQLAIIEAGQAELSEVFLPYAIVPSTGRTLYHEIREGGQGFNLLNASIE